MAGIITETPIDEFISRFRSNAEHQCKIGDLHGCLEFRQLADILEKYQKIEHLIKEEKAIYMMDLASAHLWLYKIQKVVEDGNE